VKFNAFKTTMLTTEILIAALALLNLSLLFLPKINNVRVIAAITFALTVIVGLLLIRSSRRDQKQKEQIQQLASGLEQANDQLKQLDKMKSEFVSIASHQLRSPLTAIRGYSSMLLEGSFGPLPLKAKEAIDHINESSRFMASSVEDYLNVSRIQAGNMKYEYSDFNVRDLASRVADDTRPVALKKGLLLTFTSDLHKQGIVHADIGKTRQVIDNLINNSLKYTPQGSINIVVRDDSKLKKIYIDVRDTGIGMNPHTLENIFGKFERASNANDVNVTGTGLGLYIARKMAREMKGDVTAHSEGEGKGSTFTVELPLMM
jgi:signal transduction histidine kinase